MAAQTVQWEHGLLQVKLPLPFALKSVNSYVLTEPAGGYTLIDPGLRTEETLAAWEEVFANHSFAPEQITRIVLTHQHPDHYGLAGHFAELSGAPVLMSRRAHRYAKRLWGADSTMTEELAALFALHGMPQRYIDEISSNLSSFHEKVSPQPLQDQMIYIEAGETLELGGSQWELLDAPGHAYGQLCFYEASKKWMICGDQVLPRITPNISVMPGEEINPLGDFLASLDHLSEYEVLRAFPGHYDSFTTFASRIAEIKQHHVERLEQMLVMLEEPLTGFEVCGRSFGARAQQSPHQHRFAMAETLAHLYELEQSDRISRTERAGIIYFFK
ncbi:Glyoxylase, beta-lactamase superfamily II [Paenibacillus algorifonticola]|uniref:Glyoxylase, beta-lactamase superfamily II n=1 Tax=Paenibacillus algorifonticola TaxID=684063 RepID=A0A1I2B577_9BACL|nr:MBL fold metallo-hydrolase [Paenibacillus algorifonticola]SFE50443.1 Glyoxylase, beta-lactamase superfamily II [Paenibacillus algorifonticola]